MLDFPTRPTARDVVELLWLPLIIGVATAVATWLIWYYTSVPCAPEAAAKHMWNPTPAARYINLEIWSKCVTLSLLTGGLGGGGLDIMVFSRERAGRIAAEMVIEEERKRFAEERKRFAEEHKRLEEERVADRRRLEEEHSRLMQVIESQNALLQQQATEAPRQNMDRQQAVLDVLAALTAELAELRRQRNGGNGHQ